MKHELKISQLAMVCVLCATAACPAFGASSVRTLGGAGTYSSASNAATAKATAPVAKTGGNTTGARAGAVRVSPTAAKSTVSAGGADGATTPRLSIGKYLGSGVSLSGGSSIKNQATGSVGGTGGSAVPGTAADLDALNKRIDGIDAVVADMYGRGELDDVLDDKQDLLQSRDEFVVIDGSDIYLDVDNLSDALASSLGQGGVPVADVQIAADDTGIKWRQGDGAWEYLAGWDKLTGPKGDKGDNADFDAVVLNAAVTEAVETATKDFLTSSDLPTKVSELENDAGYITNSALTGYATKVDLAEKADADALGEYAKTADIIAKYATKEQLDKAVMGGIDLTGYVTTGAMDAALADKADKSELSSYVTVTALADKADKTSVDSISSELEAINTSIASNATAAANAQTAADNAVAALGNKADKTEIPSKLSDLENDSGYAKMSDIETAYASQEQLDKVIAGGIELNGYAKAEELGTLAELNKVDTAQITDGAVTQDKLSESVQTALDDSVKVTDVDKSRNQILAIYDGQQAWLEIAE